MTTPICDFVKNYVNRDPLRLHMPGHKGSGALGIEALDLTEVEGADVLYRAQGIIRESEDNAASLFGSRATFYSTEGSSLCIRAMVYLALLHARSRGLAPRIAAGRNAHRSFLSAVALLDAPVEWLWGEELLSATVGPEELEALFASESPPTAVYLTSPDYLGRRADLSALAAVCHAHGALLLVDNAHGAYLRFLPQSLHPLDLGCDLCCDSAHKTLPVLTGGAYLHVGRGTWAELLAGNAENALALFASTSPSYLILQSLDAFNPLPDSGFREELARFVRALDRLKERLSSGGFVLVGEEPLKLTIASKSHGFRGTELARFLRKRGAEVEFADPDYLVLMPSPRQGETALDQLEGLLAALPWRAPIRETPPPLPRPRRILSPREALLSPRETVPLARAVGRVLADPAVSCPPAVPILVCGEEIGPEAAACFAYYGMDSCPVIQ